MIFIELWSPSFGAGVTKILPCNSCAERDAESIPGPQNFWNLALQRMGFGIRVYLYIYIQIGLEEGNRTPMQISKETHTPKN